MALTPVWGRGVGLVMGCEEGCGKWEWGEIGIWGRTFKDADGSGEVVDTTGSAEGSNDHGWGGDEIVGEGIVQVTLLPSNYMS